MAELRPRKRLSKGLPRTIIAILVAVIAIVSITVLSLGRFNSSNRVQASTAMPNQKRYKATRPIVVDQQTGQARMPNQQEIDETVATLSVLAQPAGGLAASFRRQRWRRYRSRGRLWRSDACSSESGRHLGNEVRLYIC